MTTLIAVFCLLAGLSAAVADTMGRRSEYGVLKVLAATAYIVFAIQLGATATLYGQLVLVALAFSWVGDLFLIGTGRLFLAGLASFLLAQLVYAGAFVVRGVDLVPGLVGAAVMAVVGFSMMRWLRRADLPGPYRAPVAAYLAAIGVMVALALGTAWPDLAVGGDWAATARSILLGAGAFAVSDILVARQRFVQPDAWNRLVGLPLYLAAQLLLASSV